MTVCSALRAVRLPQPRYVVGGLLHLAQRAAAAQLDRLSNGVDFMA